QHSAGAIDHRMGVPSGRLRHRRTLTMGHSWLQTSGGSAAGGLSVSPVFHVVHQRTWSGGLVRASRLPAARAVLTADRSAVMGGARASICRIPVICPPKRRGWPRREITSRAGAVAVEERRRAARPLGEALLHTS